METYGKILLVAMPAFLLLVIFEKLYGLYVKNDTVRSIDMFSSLSSGITNVTKDVLGLSITVISYEWMVSHWSLFTIQNSWLTYVIAFFALDLKGYLVHRIDHRINFFWNSHIIHHSSEEFNLACALRQSISSFFLLFSFFLIPAAIVGVPATVIAVVAPLHLFAQFWYHTRHIGKMGFLEYIIVTPSHHRVHHAINPEYIDKNYSQIFIFWDKLFGTFQEELADQPPVYGITRPVSTWNPIKINFQHFWLLLTDAWRTRSWKDKFRVWWMPTGWRPSDVAERYPIQKIENVYDFYKYDKGNTRLLIIWNWVFMVSLLLFVSYLFGNIATIGSPQMFLYGTFIFLSVYTAGEMMDENRNAIFWELIKAGLGLGIIFYTGDWFGISKHGEWFTDLVAGWLVLQTLLVGWIINNNFGRESKLLGAA
jgi:sterol desaturase/sphingolipid hydroxylase (fatty acid hydroxylase superfamily)